MQDNIYIYRNKSMLYPSDTDCFSPSEYFPEYNFSVISKNQNNVYHGIRECLHMMGLDSTHFGNTKWNPLGDIIVPGNTVLIKPNLVRHHNPNGGLECLVTHPSVVRAIIDYCLIALKGTGRLIVGDAPVQSCDFDNLIQNSGYQKLINFYKEQGINIEWVDFRGTISKHGTNGVLIQCSNKERHDKSKIVNIGRESAFYSLSQEEQKKLRITNYASAETSKHHYGEIHEYCVSDYVLGADVIINMPKPKTHRKAGITACLKNMVGISVEKDFLPHHRKGGKKSGGDEYPEDTAFLKIQTFLNEKIDNANAKKHYNAVKCWHTVRLGLSAWGRLTKRKKTSFYREGSWYGNDTIWRTISDLNRIVIYADKNGIMQNIPQRKMFCVADMVVAGQGEGPLAPTPNPMGTLIFGKDPIGIDRIVVALFGLDIEKFPSINRVIFGDNFKLVYKTSKISSNDPKLNAHKIGEIDYTDFQRVKLPSGWDFV